MKLPTITVVTPSFNQGQFIEGTIKSVITQGYPGVEYIVIDGGSSDNSIEIIKRYEGGITYWVSERDSGQSEAINKGFRRATGDILCWLNSDDCLAPGALQFVGSYFQEHSDVDVICGDVRAIDEVGKDLYFLKGKYGGRVNLLRFWRSYAMHQPSIFWRRRVYETLGGVNERLYLSMDYDYWLRMASEFHIVDVDKTLALATIHAAQKTAVGGIAYRREQLGDVLRHYAVPRRLADFRLSLILYGHLLKTIFFLMANQSTAYTGRVFSRRLERFRRRLGR